MTRKIILPVFLIVFLYSCTTRDHEYDYASRFKSFEISYTTGWNKGFSFLVDSNKIYFLKQRPDTLCYGILPDSIFRRIDSVFIKIRPDTFVKSKRIECIDCPVVAIQAVKNNDTIRMNQYGENINKIFYSLVDSLQFFLDHSKHQKIRTFLYFETENVTSPLPPKIIR
jgi:hypothetical protein